MRKADVTPRGSRRVLANDSAAGPDGSDGRAPEAVRLLAGGVAHDLNNILLVVQGYTDMAAAEADAGSPVMAMLAEVGDATGRAARLVRDLLVIAGSGPVSPRPADLNEAVERSLGTGSPFSWRPGAGLPPLVLDEPLFTHMIGVLSSWARETGGKTPVLRTEPLGAGGELRARLLVELPGAVFTPDATARLFDPYVRGADGGKGPGLCLAVVQAIALRHGGTVSAESAPGAGTRIVVELPAGSPGAADAPPLPAPPTVAAPRAAAPPAAPARSAAPTRTLSILLAEDDEALRAIALKVLQREGYTVVPARDGQEAVELFERHRDVIGLLLLDEVMPRMGGRAVLGKIRAQRPDIPAIMTGGYAWGLAEPPQAADFAVLPKPWRPRELLDKVRRQLDAPL